MLCKKDHASFRPEFPWDEAEKSIFEQISRLAFSSLEMMIHVVFYRAISKITYNIKLIKMGNLGKNNGRALWLSLCLCGSFHSINNHPCPYLDLTCVLSLIR